MATKPERQFVDSCHACPFASDETNAVSDQWACHGKYTREGWPRKIGTPRACPPRWCPLRKAPRLIVLLPRPRRRSR